MTAVTIRDAATLAVVRDAAAGVEVCVLRRNAHSAFVAGAYLFPGGAVDDADQAAAAERPTWLAGAASAAEADAARAAPFASVAHRIAAVRETLEEAALPVGLRLAGGGEPDLLADDARRELDQVRTGATPALAALLTRRGWQLDLRALHYLAHWVTPAGAPRRYDTRFFLAAAPSSAPELAHDGTEVVAAEWVRPADLLERHASGEAPMLPPTQVTLAWLAEAGASVADVLSAATALTDVPRIEPRVVTDHAGQRRIVKSADPDDPEGRRDGASLLHWKPPS